MTTTLGFVRSDTFDHELGEGGTIALLAALAKHAPEQRLRVWGAEGGYLEVLADGACLPKVFGEDEDPEEELEPTVRQLGYIGWPSDAAPSLPGLIVPGWDDQWNLAAVRKEPLLARAMPPEWIGCTDDAYVYLAAPVYDADDVPHEREQAESARNLLEAAACLGLVMVYR